MLKVLPLRKLSVVEALDLPDRVRVLCVKVVDGDTIHCLSPLFKNPFPVRLSGINAPEMSEGGDSSKVWLKSLVEDKFVELSVDPKNPVGKYGRLIASVYFFGLNLSDLSLSLGYSSVFGELSGKIPRVDKLLRFEQWYKPLRA